MMNKEANMSKVAKGVEKAESKLDKLHEKIRETYAAIEAAKAELAVARKAARESIQIEKTAAGFKMVRGTITLMVRQSNGRYRDFNAYCKGKKVASYANGYDMQTDFAMGRLAGFDTK